MEKFSENIGKDVLGVFADAAKVERGGCRGEQSEIAAKRSAIEGDGVRVSLARSEKKMIEAAKVAAEKVAAKMFAENLEEILRENKRAVLRVFFAEKKALEILGGKNAAIFRTTCLYVFSGRYERVDADTFKACRADAIEDYRAKIEAEKAAKSAAKVEAATAAAVAAAGLTPEQAAALMAAGLLKF